MNPGPGGGPTDRVPPGFLAPQPVITSFTPNTARQASQVSAVISGQNLVNVVSVSFAPGDVSATVQPGGDASTLNLSIIVDGGAAIGSHSVTVETGSGATTFANALQIQRSPPPNTLPLPIYEVETGSPRSGYAVVTPDSGSSMPQATLTFGLVQNGILQSQATVLPNAPVDHAVISADIVPGIGRYVAFAIVNTGSVPASMSLTLRDEDGNVAATTSLTLQSRQQIAKFLSEILSVGAAFRGSLTIQSSTPVYIVGLRFTGPVMSTITISGTAASQTNSNSLVFPQFALGGGSATTLALVNDSTSTITGRVDIFDQSGNPMVVRLNGATQSTFSYTIAARGSLTFAPRDSNGQSPF